MQRGQRGALEQWCQQGGKRVSILCAKVTVCTVAHTRISIDDKEKLQKMEDEKYFNTITDTIMEIDCPHSS